MTTSLPNDDCNVTATTSGTEYTLETPNQEYFNQVDEYEITIISGDYAVSQVDNVSLYLGDILIYSFGDYLVFSGNSRTLTLPTEIPESNCYNIRITDGALSCCPWTIVSPTFIIIP